MAKQDRNPPPWTDDMSDGCTGVHDFFWKKVCIAHDADYHHGGSVEDKLIADAKLYDRMCDPEWSGKIGAWLGRHGAARRRYWGVRTFTYNYPPGHPMRSDFKGRVEAFNWLGPRPSKVD